MIINGIKYRKLNKDDIIWWGDIRINKINGNLCNICGSLIGSLCEGIDVYRPISKSKKEIINFNVNTDISKPKKVKARYWIEVDVDYKSNEKYTWFIKCINGRMKCCANRWYPIKSLCLNDAKSFAKYTNLEIRMK